MESSHSEDKMTILMNKVKLLGQDYSGTPHCFPIGMNHNLFNRNVIGTKHFQSFEF